MAIRKTLLILLSKRNFTVGLSLLHSEYDDPVGRQFDDRCENESGKVRKEG